MIYVIGNWKMNLLRTEAIPFVKEIESKLPNQNKVKSVICAPYIYLHCLIHHQGENLRIGAQNMYYLEQGAYTGEVSVTMLTNIGVEYVIIGHSERRQIFKEDDELINKKVNSAIIHNLKPILCIGETLEERESNQTKQVLETQLLKDLKDIRDLSNVIIAYEPIWAIGTGKTATKEIANETISFIKETIKKHFNINLPVLYGGSVKVNNFEEFLKDHIIDGALIGGASLDPNNFIEFTKIAEKY